MPPPAHQRAAVRSERNAVQTEAAPREPSAMYTHLSVFASYLSHDEGGEKRDKIHTLL